MLSSTAPALADHDLCHLCVEQRRLTPSGAQPACHEILCRAFFTRSSDAMACVLTLYTAEFIAWITHTAVFPHLMGCYPELEPTDILHDVIAQIFRRTLAATTDCQTSFPSIPSLMFFIKVSIRNREITLLRRCRTVAPEDEAATLMEKIEPLVRALLTEDEYLVWEFWIYGEPERAFVLVKVGGENRLNALKKQVRKKLFRNDDLRGLLDLTPYTE
jgi:hypothetical protein